MKYYVSFFEKDITKINKWYDAFPQFKLNDGLNTELETIEFTLSVIEEKIDLQMKKYNGLIPVVIKLEKNNRKKYYYYYLSNSRYDIVAYNPKKYKYFIQCVSLELELQRITLPNKLITQPIIGTPRTIFQEMQKIMDVYAPHIDYYFLNDALNIPCPELQFTKSTLHEVLITLFAVARLVPKMYEFNSLDYRSLDAIDYSHSINEFIRVSGSETIETYADALDFDIENAISVDNDITTTWILPTSEDPIISTENFIWKVPSEIYEIEKVEVQTQMSFYALNGSNSVFHDDIDKLDITAFVVAKEVWDTFLVNSQLGFNAGNYKRNFLYYENNTIVGNFSESSWLGLDSEKSIYNAIYFMLTAIFGIITDLNINDYREIKLKVTYKSDSDNSRVKIIRDGVNGIKNNLISNQDDAYIDIVNFGKQKKEFINRIGNEIITAQYSKKLTKIDDIINMPQLGEKVEEEYIITQREIMLNENTINANYLLAKNYAFQSGFSGLNQVKRFTSIDTNNMLIRNDLFIVPLKFTTRERGDLYFFDNVRKQFLYNYGVETQGKTLHKVETYNASDVKLNQETNQSILVTSQNKKIADSIICQFNFETNVKIGDNIEYIKSTNPLKDDTFIKQPVKYTDSNGEFKTLKLEFGGAEQYRNETNDEIVRKFPLLNTPVPIEHEEFLINKDNREITSITLQFKVNNTNDCVIYDDFYKYSPLINHNNCAFKVYSQFVRTEEEFEQNKYTNKTTYAKGDYLNFPRVEIGTDYLIPKISVKNVLTDSGYFMIGICDGNDNLLVGINYLNVIPTNTNIDLFLEVDTDFLRR